MNPPQQLRSTLSDLPIGAALDCATAVQSRVFSNYITIAKGNVGLISGFSAPQEETVA